MLRLLRNTIWMRVFSLSLLLQNLVTRKLISAVPGAIHIAAIVIQHLSTDFGHALSRNITRGLWAHQVLTAGRLHNLFFNTQVIEKQ
jgi:hypothetical protein